MKNINKDSFGKDLSIINDMLLKYSDAVYEKQDGQVGHYDNQLKLVRLCIEDIRVGLNIVKSGLRMLDDVRDCLIEDG